MKIFSHLFLCPFFLFLLLVHTASGSSKQVYTIGVEDFKDFLPYSDYRDGRFSGLGKDILELFANQHGYHFTYVPLPLKRRDRMYLNQKLDFAFPDHPDWAEDKKEGISVHYAEMLEYIDGVIVLPENLGKGLPQIRMLGTPRGYTPSPYLKKQEEGAVYIAQSNFNGLFLKLLKGKLDGVYVNVKVSKHVWYGTKQMEKRSFVFDPSLPHIKGFWSFSSILYPKVVQEFRMFLKKNVSEIDAMKRKYHFFM